ncbi:MAG: response regulator [Planctomycetaceae bacterium]|nr:MAG: response regulator [Planctomycetaceae bacterium]
MADELAGKTILMVDDDRDILTAMQSAMAELGATVLLAIDGNEALALNEQHHPDLVVLDQMLPKRSGFLVMEKINRAKKTRNDPPRVIMITGNLGSRHKVYAESLGVALYLNKPFRMEKLVEGVKKLLGVP